MTYHNFVGRKVEDMEMENMRCDAREEESEPYPRWVTVEERNEVMPYMGTVNSYQSGDMPKWFKPLQSIVETRAFTGMTVNLGDVHYIILPVDETADESSTLRQAPPASPFI